MKVFPDNESVSRLHLLYDEILNEGEYYIWGQIGQVSGQHFEFRGDKNCAPMKENPGILHIDYINEEDQIIAGHFEFDGVCEDGDTIKVRDGWFDLNY